MRTPSAFTRGASFAIILITTSSLFAQQIATPQERAVIEWVVRSLVQQQQHDWSDWSEPADRRAVLVAKETIPFPAFADAEDSLAYAVDSLSEKHGDLSVQLRSTRVVKIGKWSGGTDDAFPPLNVVPAETVAGVFDGEALDSSVALVIRTSTPVFSNNGDVAVVYAEAVGSHVENSYRQLVKLTRKADRPGDWDAVIDSGRLFPPAKALAHERQISPTDRAAMTAALQWLVKKRGGFDLVGLTDISADAVEWRRLERESESSFKVPEATLLELSRRNHDFLEFDTSIFSIEGVRNLTANDDRIWTRPSVLVSLPAYDEDVAILSISYRTADEIPETEEYFVRMRRVNGEWSVVWTAMREGIIIS